MGGEGKFAASGVKHLLKQLGQKRLFYIKIRRSVFSLGVARLMQIDKVIFPQTCCN